MIEASFERAATVCADFYGFAPELDLKSHNATSENPKEVIELCYFPENLSHILFELFKNAMRAVVENRKKNTFNVPDIEVKKTVVKTH